MFAQNNMSNPFAIGSAPIPTNQRSSILEQALAATNNPDQKLKLLQDAQFGQLVDEGINKQVTNTNVLQKLENAIIPQAQASTITNPEDIDFEEKAKLYAKWIVENKDKKGTPEFEKVAKAYQTARANIVNKTSMLDAAKASIQNVLPANVAGGFKSLVDMYLNSENADVNSPIFGILQSLSQDAGDFQTDLMAEVGKKYKGRPNDIPGSVLQGLQAGDYAGAAKALGYGVAEGIGTSAPGFIAGLIKRYPAVAALSSVPNGLQLLQEKVESKREKDINATLNAQDILVVAGQLGLDLIPMKKSFMKDMMGEAAIETGQDATTILNTMSQGGNYTMDEIADSLVESATVGAATQGTLRTASNVGGKFTPNIIKRAVGGNPNKEIFQQTTEEKDTQSIKADLARNLNQMANDSNINMSDVDRESSSGARVLMDNMQRELSGLISDTQNTIKNSITPSKGDSLDKIIEKSKAKSSVARAKNKVKNTTFESDYNRIRDLAPPEAKQEVERLINYMKQANELTNLQAGGVKGGVSRITDELMPFGKTSNYLPSGVAGGLRPTVAIGAAAATSGFSLAGQLVGVGLGRFADAMTGRRSPVKKFVKQYKGLKGSRDLTGLPSITRYREQRKKTDDAEFQAERKLNRQANINMPIGIDRQLDDQGILPVEQDKGMNILLRDKAITKAQYDAFYNNPMSLQDTSQGYVKILSGLNRLAKQGRINQSPTPVPTQAQSQQTQSQTTQAQQPQSTPQASAPPLQQPTPEQVKSGKEANRRFLDNMADLVDANEKGVTKALMLSGLEEMRLLSGMRGNDVLQECNRIYLQAFAINPKAADKYLWPYVKRVERQQFRANTRVIS